MSSVNNSHKKDMDQIEGPWTPEEDRMLQILFEKHFPNWSPISKSIPGRSDQSCRIRWFTLKCVHMAAFEDNMTRFENNWATVGHRTISAHDINIPPPVLNFSLAVGGVRGQLAPSIGDMARLNVSQPWGGMHSYTGEQSPPSWDAFNKRHSASMMIDTSDNVQEFMGDKFGSQNSIPEGNSSHEVGGIVSGRPPSISDMDTGSQYSIYEGNSSHEVVGMVSGQAPSVSDMARENMSSGGTHSYSRDHSAPSWNAINKRDSSPMMTDSYSVQESMGGKFGWNDFSEVSSKA